MGFDVNWWWLTQENVLNGIWFLLVFNTDFLVLFENVVAKFFDFEIGWIVLPESRIPVLLVISLLYQYSRSCRRNFWQGLIQFVLSFLLGKHNTPKSLFHDTNLPFSKIIIFTYASILKIDWILKRLINDILFSYLGISFSFGNNTWSSRLLTASNFGVDCTLTLISYNRSLLLEWFIIN